MKHGEKISRIRVYYEEDGKDKLKLVYDDDEFISCAAKPLKGACLLIEAGFECITDMNGYKLFRKRR